MSENKCDSCANEFATCKSIKIVWGIDVDSSARGKDADKVIKCDAYIKKEVIK